MAAVTIRVLEGLERGRVFMNLKTPVAIGREDENDIQLNDERVSRFHAKLQEDGGRVILTDLDSTNGTRVNGHPVQMRVLQDGDLLAIGRCLLLFGQPAAPSQAAAVEGDSLASGKTAFLAGRSVAAGDEDDDFASFPPGTHDDVGDLFPKGAPDVPEGLRPLQRAQISDLLAYLHEQLGSVLQAAAEEERADGSRTIRCDWQRWQQLLELQSRLAQYLRRIAEPGE
jgi:hypothetical protein